MCVYNPSSSMHILQVYTTTLFSSGGRIIDPFFCFQSPSYKRHDVRAASAVIFSAGETVSERKINTDIIILVLHILCVATASAYIYNMYVCNAHKRATIYIYYSYTTSMRFILYAQFVVSEISKA